MRLSWTTAILVMGLPAFAHADAASDVLKIFGRDPGADAAHACFVRHYTKAHLASHPKQNVTDMLVYVDKQEGTDPYYNLNMQVNFRQLHKPFQVSGSCGGGADGKHALSCGIDCDGGHIDVRVKDQTSLLVEIPEYARIYDPAETDDENGGELPKNARFGADDKVFRVDRTDLRECAPLIYDDDLKAQVAKGAVTR